MTKRKMGVLLVLGIVVGLAVSACAGAAVGQSDFQAGPSIFGTNFDTLTLPAFSFAPAQPMLVNVGAVGQAVEMAMRAQQAVSLFSHDGGCHGGDGYYGNFTDADD